MPSNRAKGLQLVRRVKHYLQAEKFLVEGPGYKPLFAGGKMIAVHSDFFGCFDILSVSKDEGIRGHQVCSKANKTRNAKKIQSQNLSGYLWCKGEGPECDRYWVSQDGVEWVDTVKI